MQWWLYVSSIMNAAKFDKKWIVSCSTSLQNKSHISCSTKCPLPPEHLPLTLLFMTQKVNQPTKQTSGGSWRRCSLGSSGAKKAQFPPRGRGAVDPSQLACAHQNQNHLKMPTTQPKFDQQTNKLVLPGMRCNGDDQHQLKN